ncbi:MAG: hypothetical protein ACC642_07580 [Pseudomonadales bacterium]
MSAPCFAPFGLMRPTDSIGIIHHMMKQRATMQDPAIYRVCVEGRIPLDWSARLMGMNITNSDAVENDQKTFLVGRLPDQAALIGVMNILYEQQFPVVSVECLEVG